MKKLLVTILMAGTLHVAIAYDYPYMVFQTADGSMHAIAADELTISFTDGQLVAANASDSQTFPLAQMSKMYFSADNITSIQTVGQDVPDTDGTTEIYDLQGRLVKGQGAKAEGLRNNGIYIVKTKKGIRKVYIK